jgi:hypothetical protein
VVPVVLWMSGVFGPHKGKPGAMQHTVASASTSASDLKAAEVRTVKVQVRPVEKPTEAVAQFVTGSVDPRAAIESGHAAPEQPAASALAARFAERRSSRRTGAGAWTSCSPRPRGASRVAT